MGERRDQDTNLGRQSRCRYGWPALRRRAVGGHGLALLTAVALATAALALAGCGGGSGGESNPGSAKAGRARTGPLPGGTAILTVAGVPKLGRVLVDSHGFTVYGFSGDRGAASSCYGACARAWPPLTTSSPPASGEGAAAAKLGTLRRRDGNLQVTYAGHPLYTFARDRRPGEARGAGNSAFGGRWFPLSGSGAPAGG